jgi:RNA 3'-terminal phosphate cyclase
MDEKQRMVEVERRKRQAKEVTDVAVVGILHMSRLTRNVAQEQLAGLEERMRQSEAEIQARATAFSSGSETTQQLVASLQLELQQTRKEHSDTQTRANGLFTMCNELQQHTDELQRALATRHSRQLKLYVATYGRSAVVLFLVCIDKYSLFCHVQAPVFSAARAIPGRRARTQL